MDATRLMEDLDKMAENAINKLIELTKAKDVVDGICAGIEQCQELVQQHLDHADECRIAQEDAEQPTPEAFPHLDADGEPGVTDGGVPGG